ncbi:hypothetical protein BH23THE1_BH23THE1_11690 [soil metagenome]
MVEYPIISVSHNRNTALLEIEDKELLNAVVYQSRILGNPNRARVVNYWETPNPLRLILFVSSRNESPRDHLNGYASLPCHSPACARYILDDIATVLSTLICD